MNGPRVAVVGAGLMGRWHIDAARRAGARVIAVVDSDIARARHVAPPRASSHATLRAALAEAPDFVHVCTPLDSHEALCTEALAAPCHVIVEKPAVADAAAARAIGERARDAGRMVVPVHQFGYQRGVRRLEGALPTIGPLHHVEFATCSAGADRPGAPDRDRIAAEIVPHGFALVRQFLGVSVGSLDWRLNRPAPGEWNLDTVAGTCGITIRISLASRPTLARWHVAGSNGSGTADLFHGFAVVEGGHASRSYKVVRPLAVGSVSALAAAANLVTRLATGVRAYPGLRELFATTYAAADGGPAPFRNDELVDVAVARDRVCALAGIAAPR